MKIAIIATHSFPIPYPNLHTGDLVILNLAKTLKDLGNTVSLFAPEKSDFDRLYPIKASFGHYPPSSDECELKCYNDYRNILVKQDIVHDFSNTKRTVQMLNNEGFTNTVSTILGGAWKQNNKAHNLITWSAAHKERVSRGATDYENTPTPNLAGSNGNPTISKVVYGGIDTSFYTPSYDKENFFLWIGRWHNVRGYELAIDIAVKSKINLVLAGEDPDNELFDSQKQAAYAAMELAAGYSNIKFAFLPPDPHHHIAKRKLLRQARAMLYTVQFHEPFGLSQVEALACGTPVIGPNFGSVPEIVVNGKTGFVCENNVDSYISAIKNIDNIDYEICRNNAVKRFDKNVMAKKYLEIYKDVIAGGSW